jgi:hypothetical protein
MRSLVTLAVFIVATALFVIVVGLLGGVGSVELLGALTGASVVTAAWVHRSTHPSRRASG